MTSIDFDALNKQREKQEKCEQMFYQWCVQQNVTPLSRWLADNKVLSQDLFAAGLINYDNPEWLPVSMSIFSEPKLTEQALALLGQHFPAGCNHFDSFRFSYLLDESLFHQVLEPHLLKSSAQRRRDFIAEYKAKHGYIPSQEEIERSKKAGLNGLNIRRSV